MINNSDINSLIWKMVAVLFFCLILAITLILNLDSSTIFSVVFKNFAFVFLCWLINYFLNDLKEQELTIPFVFGFYTLCWTEAIDYLAAKNSLDLGGYLVDVPWWGSGYAKTLYFVIAMAIGFTISKVLAAFLKR